jgi:hypothetical protein
MKDEKKCNENYTVTNSNYTTSGIFQILVCRVLSNHVQSAALQTTKNKHSFSIGRLWLSVVFICKMNTPSNHVVSYNIRHIFNKANIDIGILLTQEIVAIQHE